MIESDNELCTRSPVDTDDLEQATSGMSLTPEKPEPESQSSSAESKIKNQRSQMDRIERNENEIKALKEIMTSLIFPRVFRNVSQDARINPACCCEPRRRATPNVETQDRRGNSPTLINPSRDYCYDFMQSKSRRRPPKSIRVKSEGCTEATSRNPLREQHTVPLFETAGYARPNPGVNSHINYLNKKYNRPPHGYWVWKEYEN